MLSIDEEYEALTQFLYLAPVGLVQLDMAGEIALINPLSAQLLMPLSPDGDLSNFFDVISGVAPDLHHMAATFNAPHGMVCEALRLQVDAGVHGKSDPRVLSLSLLKLDATRLMAVVTDVSQQVKRERLLRHNEAWLNAIITGVTSYAIISLDAHGRVDAWNESITRVTGFTREQVLGQPYAIFYPSDATTAERVTDRLRDADEQGWSIDDGWRVKADGTRFWGTAMIAPLLGHQRRGASDASDLPDLPEQLIQAVSDEANYCLIIRDITDKREASERLHQATSCDHLTGLANRRAFFELAEQEVERYRRQPRPLSLVLFDADHFKRVNDTYGHPTGDAVLCHLAGLLKSAFRQVDVVARFGGEEFAVLLPSTDAKGAFAVAERLRLAVAGAEVVVDGQRIVYTVSGGVATLGDGVQSLDELIKCADSLLYAAKAAGRNRIACLKAAPDVTAAV
jgi:diguanylate cyclase (GGDEF)-like protein/PAS domain S-box-containing protein